MTTTGNVRGGLDCSLRCLDALQLHLCMSLVHTWGWGGVSQGCKTAGPAPLDQRDSTGKPASLSFYPGKAG